MIKELAYHILNWLQTCNETLFHWSKLFEKNEHGIDLAKPERKCECISNLFMVKIHVCIIPLPTILGNDLRTVHSQNPTLKFNIIRPLWPRARLCINNYINKYMHNPYTNVLTSVAVVHRDII